jgi:CTP synthase (UTP-ammonia lyase)
LAYKIYGTTLIEERHRHRFEVNVDLLPKIIKGEGQFTATDKTR